MRKCPTCPTASAEACLECSKPEELKRVLLKQARCHEIPLSPTIALEIAKWLIQRLAEGGLTLEKDYPWLFNKWRILEALGIHSRSRRQLIQLPEGADEREADARADRFVRDIEAAITLDWIMRRVPPHHREALQAYLDVLKKDEVPYPFYVATELLQERLREQGKEATPAAARVRLVRALRFAGQIAK